MSDRVNKELELLRAAFGELDYESEGHWVRLPAYPVPAGWSASEVEVAFQIPPEVAVPPYAFGVRPAMQLEGGAVPSNYTFPAPTPWSNEWGRFSWSPLSWQPHAEVERGDNMVHFARSFADRFQDLG